MPDERNPAQHALVVSGSAEHARMFEGALAALEAWDWVRVGRRIEAAAMLRLKAFTVVLVDTDDGAWDADTWKILKELAGLTPILMVGASAGAAMGWEQFSYARLAAALAALSVGSAPFIQARPSRDPATGLPEAGHFMEQANRLCASLFRQRGGATALWLHWNGEEPASAAGRRPWLNQAVLSLRACLREGDLVGRMGERELALLLPGRLSPQEAAAQGRRILEALRALAPGFSGAPRASLGASFWPGAHSSTKQLFEAARQGSVRSSALGGDCFHFDDPQLDEEGIARFRVEVDLRRAMAAGHLNLLWLPQADLAGAVVGAEIRLRWLHPERGPVAPADFLPFAEANGVLDSLLDWTLLRALKGAKEIQGVQPDFRITVRLLPSQFRDTGLVRRVLEGLRSAETQGKCLCLEVAKSEALTDIEGAADKLRLLRAEGIQIALDEFGGLCSPAGWLKRLPLDRIKLDKSLVHDLDRQADDERIAEWVVSLSHQMGFFVIAEGVERNSQLHILKRIGCDQYQGDLLAAAQPFERFERWLSDCKLVKKEKINPKYKLL